VEVFNYTRIFSGRLIAKPDLKRGFGAELKRRRMESGMSQETLAELADLHRTYISAVESGRRNLTLESIQRLASALGASVASFFSSVEGAALAGSSTALEYNLAVEKGGTILLVEDDPKDVEFTMVAFKTARLANHVEVVRDGAAALDILLGSAGRRKAGQRPLPQVVLLDLQLPKVHGLEVLRRLRAESSLERLPIVVLTASRSDRDLQEAMRLGANAYLIKPVDFARFASIAPKLSFRWALL
jgi:CheY-like chemotaxis protein/DNA-binding XRE family transcriptional regulator